ncbi:MAG: septation regulator SpoVG [Terriglobia bacterium]
MNITRVAVRPVEMNKVKAMVSITIDDSFVVHGLRVVEGERGFFVAMPSRRLPSGEYRDIAHPINSETREMVESLVLGEFRKAEENVEASDASSQPPPGPAQPPAGQADTGSTEPAADEPPAGGSGEPGEEGTDETKDEDEPDGNVIDND